MTKQVPEGDQMKALEEFVTGSRAFAKVRGTLGRPIHGAVCDMISSTTSPTAFLRQYDEFAAAVRIVGNKLACLRRDGMDLAESQFIQALQARDHRLPFEATAPCPKRPFTVVMLDPERTLVMIRWIVKEHWLTLDEYLRGDRPSAITKALFETFPTLLQHSMARRDQGQYEGSDLIASYVDTVRKEFGEGIEPLKRWRKLFLGHDQYNDHIEIGTPFNSVPFCYVVAGTQAEVLSWFSREQQSLVGTWQLQIPDTVDPVDSNLGIGFHVEAEHEAWTEEYPDYVSKSVNHGFGTILLRDGLDPSGEDLIMCKKLDNVGHFGWRNKDEEALRFRVD